MTNKEDIFYVNIGRSKRGSALKTFICTKANMFPLSLSVLSGDYRQFKDNGYHHVDDMFELGEDDLSKLIKDKESWGTISKALSFKQEHIKGSVAWRNMIENRKSNFIYVVIMALITIPFAYRVPYLGLSLSALCVIFAIYLVIINFIIDKFFIMDVDDITSADINQRLRKVLSKVSRSKKDPDLFLGRKCPNHPQVIEVIDKSISVFNELKEQDANQQPWKETPMFSALNDMADYEEMVIKDMRSNGDNGIRGTKEYKKYVIELINDVNNAICEYQDRISKSSKILEENVKFRGETLSTIHKSTRRYHPHNGEFLL